MEAIMQLPKVLSDIMAQTKNEQEVIKYLRGKGYSAEHIWRGGGGTYGVSTIIDGQKYQVVVQGHTDNWDWVTIENKG
jgi:hypothetical protein